jgi:hypothetical protein
MIAILGGGLSGLMTGYMLQAYGATQDIIILEKRHNLSFSNMSASFYCHEYLNDKLTPKENKFLVRWIVNGNIKDPEKKYSMKVYDQIQDVSLKVTECEGYNLDILEMISKCSPSIRLSSDITDINIYNKVIKIKDGDDIKYDKLISTIAMPIFMNISGEGRCTFDYRPIFTKTEYGFRTHNDNSITLEYFPDPAVHYYRKTYHNEKCEVVTESLEQAKGFYHKIFPGKIRINTEQQEHLNLFSIAMRKQGIYFFGRYAQWDPKVLITDVYENITKNIGEIIYG